MLRYAGGKFTIDDIELTIRQQQGLTLLDTKLSTKEKTVYTTVRAYQVENELVKHVVDGNSRFKAVVDPNDNDFINNEIKAYEKKKSGDFNIDFKLNSKQRHAIYDLLNTRDAIYGVQGYAGVGKTTSLEVVAQIAEKKGFRVRGFAAWNSAADQLQSETGVESQTIDSHFVENLASEIHDKQAGKELWIIDEQLVASF